jgi:hypothetical protein
MTDIQIMVSLQVYQTIQALKYIKRMQEHWLEKQLAK